MSILICYDDSDSARHAVAATAAVLKGEQATLLHVWSPPERVLPDSFGTPVENGGPSVEVSDLLGSVSNPVAHHSHRPVLLVPASPTRPGG